MRGKGSRAVPPPTNAILGRVEGPETMTFEQCVDALRKGKPDERAQAVAELGKLRDVRGVGLLRTALKDSDPVVRDNAAFALAEMGAREAIPDLLPLLEDAASTVRKSAAKALGLLKARQAVPRLIALLKDSAYVVRKSAARSLGQIGDPSAEAPLREVQHLEAGRPMETLAKRALAEIRNAQR